MDTKRLPSWDIFCRVIDNFGDIGVCWRLARQLQREYGFRVRLWLDDLAALAAMHSSLNVRTHRQLIEGVEIILWEEVQPVDEVACVVIEAFACDLPDAYLNAMTQAEHKPVWVNLEYLTAESWAESCHGMASPHPRLPLNKYFYFPGFTARSGGLLREANILPLPSSGSGESEHALRISLFCYDNAPVADLLAALAGMESSILCLIPPGKPLHAVQAHLGGQGPWRLGNASLQPIPFLPQQEYDALLAGCDLNFVRGEDSFVRAQWAGKPFIWQIYPQAEDAHLTKLAAFFDLASPDGPWRNINEAWNIGGDFQAAWQIFWRKYDAIQAECDAWRKKLMQQPDLAAQLVKFCLARL